MTEIMEMNANSMDFQDNNENSDLKSDDLNKDDNSEEVKNDEAFEVIADAEVEEVKPKNIEHYDRALEEAITKLKGVKEISEEDLKELSDEIRRLGRVWIGFQFLANNCKLFLCLAGILVFKYLHGHTTAQILL